jgi:hypothetical protein
MTVTGSFLGTPAYMSPEQIAAGRIGVDHRTDVYSLGAVLYELLTLERPFPGDNREQVLSGIMTKDPRPPRRVNPRVPVDLETICQKALEKDRDRRYATARDMAQDLRLYLSHGVIAARRTGWARRVIKLARRRPVLTTAVGATVLLAAVLAVAWRATSQRKVEAAVRALSDAKLHQSQGAYRDALADVERAVAGSSDLPEAHLIRARLLIKLGRAAEAVSEAQELLRRRPHEWTAHLILAAAARSREGGGTSFWGEVQASGLARPSTNTCGLWRSTLPTRPTRTTCDRSSPARTWPRSSISIARCSSTQAMPTRSSSASSVSARSIASTRP